MGDRPDIRLRGLVDSHSEKIAVTRRGPVALLSDFGPHGDEFFGGGGMNPDGGIKLRFGRATIERHGETLDDFTCVGADHMTAQYSVGQAIDDQFHHRSLVAAGKRVLKRSEGSPENIDFEVTLERLLLSETDGSAGGCAKDRGGNIQIPWSRRLIVKQRIGHRHAFGDRHRRKHHAVGAIADRVNAVDVGF